MTRWLPALAALLLAGSAGAQTISPMTGTTTAVPSPARRHTPTMAERFDAANTTHDGKLTRSQAWAGHMNAVARDFKAIDRDGKGYVTMDDIRAHDRARRRTTR